ncbi:MAG: DNA phosphorothioation-dependent restriction protein DptF [Butyrivibrio sp.]|nr:DNA phosphorothioation-dependent restriction protein DptF [Butyrivibrio sp.]
MACDFVIQLSRLRKLSAESVENTSTFAPFKKYLHVERPVEAELRDLLKKVNANQGKCLVLLCGSAGDGKSHLISYLKNVDEEGLIADYELYNDATESSEPKLTSIDTLAEKLAPFNDDNCHDNKPEKMIIAINLGTLNNFIESEKGKKFSKLKKYVEENGIFSGYSQNSLYKDESVFQHVSFSDYQVFSIGAEGIETTFLENLLEKVFRKSEENPFYKAYMENTSCSMCRRCPVRHNYEFLSNPTVQKSIINRIVEVVIKDKAIVSTREVLNLLFDLIVHPDFETTKISVGTSDMKYLTNYINWTTPMLLNEYADISPLLNHVRAHDVLKMRSSASDNDATKFHSLENIHEIFNNATAETPYQILDNLTDVSVLGGIKPDLKKIVYRFIVRLMDLKSEEKSDQSHQRIKAFIKYLYFQNSGRESELGELYEATKKAVLSWEGQFDDNLVCIDNTSELLWVLERLELKAAINNSATLLEGSIQRFAPTLKMKFKNVTSQVETAEINVDFALYELISDMREGYRPTVQDKNRHADFVSFVQRLIDFGDKATRIILVPKESDKTYKMIIEKNEFGKYEFKVG